MALSIAIITCSDTRSIEEDTAGMRLEELIRANGWGVASHVIVKDEAAQIGAAIIAAADELKADVVLTCGGSGLSHAQGVLHALGGAGVGVAAVDDDALGLAVGQVFLGEDDGVGLYHVLGVGACCGAGNLGEDHSQVLLLRLGGGEVVLHAAVNACGLETLGGGDAAGNGVHMSILLVSRNG